MASDMFREDIVRRLTCISLVILLALVGLLVSVRAMKISHDVYAQSINQGESSFYLPVIIGLVVPPAGSYYCLEYEFGLIWTSEVITLNVDGSSIYDYNPPYSSIVTGTWNYIALRQEVEFTNFRWLTATYEGPDHLWASRYLTQAGFDIALSCTRQ